MPKGPLVPFLSALLGAFLAGISVIVWFNGEIEKATAPLRAEIAVLKDGLAAAKTDTEKAHQRIGSLTLTWGSDSDSTDYACGDPPKNASLGSVMVGIFDGTGCGKPSHNVFRGLSLPIPPR